MQHLMVITTLAAVILFGQQVAIEPTHNYQQVPTKNSGIERSENRPDLSLQYADAGKLKLASRKTKYRLGEMISLDLAMLNTTTTPVFFHRLVQPNFHVTARRRGPVDIVPYLIIEPMPDTDLYTLLPPGEIMTKSFELLAGCDKQAVENIGKGLDKTSKDFFEEDRFVNWGDFCLRINRPGIYTITVEQVNSNVVITANEPNAKTAIGTLRSTPLPIEIIK